MAAVTAALAQLSRLLTRGSGREQLLPRRTGGRRCRMPVQDGAIGDQEGGEGETVTGGRGERGQGGADPLLVGLRWW